MKTTNLLRLSLGLSVLIFSTTSVAIAQNNGSVAEKKFEVAGEFTTITFDVGNTKVGLGGRLTYNLNSHVALETATYIFPAGDRCCGRHAGNMIEVLGGVKIGKRWNKFGIFGKARPGILSSSDGDFDFRLTGITRTDPPSIFIPSYAFVPRRLNTFVADFGGVAEYYPTKRIILRADVGMGLVHYGSRTITFPSVDPFTGAITTQQSRFPAQNRGALQLSTGLGFRF